MDVMLKIVLNRVTPHAPRIAMAMLGVYMLVTPLRACAAESLDLAVTPLFDAQRNELLNTWGGGWQSGKMVKLSIQSVSLNGQKTAMAAETGPLAAGQQTYLQCLACGFGRTRSYYQTRDLSRYSAVRFTIANCTGAELDAALQVKDWRDSPKHRASYRYSLPPAAEWREIEVPLALDAANWTVDGAPDLSSVLTLDFTFAPRKAISAGRVYVQSVALVERAGSLPIDSTPLPTLAERIAQRQWDALWSARSRKHGLIPNNSYQSTDAGLNATAAVLWMLPAATRRHWVTQDEADRYVTMLVGTIDRLLDNSHYVPPRNVDWVTLRPSLLPEESAVDAAFLALALHQYKSLPETPAALRQALDHAENRFDFAAFACAAGWRMSYRYAGPCGPAGFVPLVYNGYTNEGNVISLAADLSASHHVPIEAHWNADIMRVRKAVLQRSDAPVVHSLSEFRAPFTQALLNLFVDVRGRGIDHYPDVNLAVNPWDNFVRYEQQVMARLAEMRRPYLVQPDAGDDGTLTNYQQYSLYNDFGQRDLFMPWSVSFAMQAQVDGSGEALRYLLRHGLHDPLGMADSAKWATGAAEPYTIAPRHDFWNTALGTMALLEWLDGQKAASRNFATLPEVRHALDRVFGGRLAAVNVKRPKSDKFQVAEKIPTSIKVENAVHAAKAEVIDISKRN